MNKMMNSDHRLFDAAGTIIKTSKDFCVVSTDIDGARKLFSFSKRLFYIFGMQYEGDLSNIVENDMQVDLCYSFCQQNKPCLVAVWLGQKPKNVYDNEPPTAFYNKEGYVSKVRREYYIVKSDIGDVVVNQDVIFRNGCPLKNEGTVLTVDVSVTFDALSFKEAHSSRASYYATCAWIGFEEPRLVDRFGLMSQVPLEQEKGNIPEIVEAYGIVTVIPNDIIALLKVESFDDKVIAFGKSFGKDCKRIQEEVNVGDSVRVELCSGYIFPGCRQRFALRAWKDGGEMSTADIEQLCSSVERLDKAGTMDPQAETSPSETDLCGIASSASDERVVLDDNGAVLWSDPPLSGVINCFSFDSAWVTFKEFKIYVEIGDLYIQGSLCSAEQFLNLVKSGDREVYFEAVKTNRKDAGETGITHDATCVWIGKKPSLDVVYSSLPAPKFSLLEANGKLFYGFVQKLYLPAIALVHVESENTTVCIDSSFCLECEDKPFFISFVVERNCWLEFEVKRHTVWPEILQAFNFTIVTKKGMQNMFYIPVSNHQEEPSDEAQTSEPFTVQTPLPNVPRDDSLPREPSYFEETIRQLKSFKMALVNTPEEPVKTLPGTGCENTGTPLQSLAFTKETPVDSLKNLGSAPPVRKLRAVSLRKSSEKPTNEKSPTDVNIKNEHVFLNSSKENVYLQVPFEKSCQEVPMEPASPKTKGKIYFAIPFIKSRPSEEKMWLLAFYGILAIEERSELAIVNHELGMAFINVPNAVIYGLNENKPMSVQEMKTYNGLEVRFDAQSTRNQPFSVTRMWISANKTTRPSPFDYLCSDIQYSGSKVFIPSRLYRGKITSIPLHDAAMAIADDVPVLITLEALITQEKISTSMTSIDTYFSVGDEVVLLIKKDYCRFEATHCWKLDELGDSKTAEDEIQLTVSRNTYWWSVWGLGEYSKKSILVRRNGGYFVDFTSSKIPNLKLSLDIFQKGKLVVDGRFVDPSRVKSFEGCEVEFDVAHKVVDDDTKLSSEFFYVVCTWIGSELPVFTVLKDKLLVPRGIVNDGYYYEGIIDEFPLPTVAICRIGSVPVLVPIGIVDIRQGTFHAHEEACLEIGKRVLIRVHEKVLNDQVFLISSKTCEITTDMGWFDVITNVPGIVVGLPCPTGRIKTIKGSNIEVQFELCHVQAGTDVNMNREEMFSWLEHLTNTIKIGIRVRFTAVRTHGCIALYRAFEVWIDDL